MRRLAGHNRRAWGRRLVGHALSASAGGGGGGAGPDWTSPYSAPADYFVTSDAEWDATMALGAAVLSGKTIEYSGSSYTPRTIPALALTAETVIRGANPAAVLPGITYTGNVTNLTLFKVNVKVQGWPKARAACIDYGLYTRTSCKEVLCDFSHGFGASLAPIDAAATLPEYNRILHSITATTTSQTVALTWPFPAEPFGGWIEFWNDGADPVYVRVNAVAVDTATAADTLCPAGQRTRISKGVNSTHLHIIAAAATSACRWTTEQGLSNWLADAYTSGGGAKSVNCVWAANFYHDLGNAIKFWAEPNQTNVFIDNKARRIYQDIFSKGFPKAANLVLYLMRNDFCQPFCKSGVDSLTGDAQDPHGDIFQMFGGTNYAPVYAAGNRTVRDGIRAGAGNQGAHFWAGGYFRDSYIIGGALFLCSNNGLTVNGPSEHVYAFGNTILNPEIPTGTVGGKVNVAASGGSSSYVGRSLVNDLTGGARTAFEGNVLLRGTVTDFLPAFAGASAATSVAALETALTEAPAYAGVCAVANKALIDWTTTDHTQVIKWSLLHPGVEWPDQTYLATSTLITTDIRKVLAGPASMTITAAAGTEYQVTSDLAGATVVTAWTSAPGTVARGHFLQLRGTTSASNLTDTALSATVNGFAVGAALRTKPADPALYFDSSGAGPVFANTGALIGTDKPKLTFRALMYLSALPGATLTLFAQQGTNLVFEMFTSGALRVLVKDSAGTAVVNNVALSASVAAGQWTEIIVSVDLTTPLLQARVNGALTDTVGIGATTGLLKNAYPLFLAKSTGGTGQFVGRFAELEYWLDAMADGTAPAGAAAKRIAGNAATVNADPWKLRADAT